MPAGRHVALFFGDYFARPSKHSGAWMTSLRDQERLRRRYPPADRQRDELHQGRRRRAGAAVASTTRARCSTNSATAARPPVGRDLSDDRRHQRRYRLRRTAVAALRALVRAARGAAAASHVHYQTGEPMPEELLRQAAGGAHLQPGLRDGGICRRRRWSISTSIRCDRPSGLDVGAFERATLDKHRHAGRDRDAPPPAAFPACLLGRRLCVGLLQLHVVGGARRRRLRGVRGDGRHLRSGRPRQGCATTSMRPAAAAIRTRPISRSAAGCRASDALLARRGLVDAVPARLSASIRSCPGSRTKSHLGMTERSSSE